MSHINLFSFILLSVFQFSAVAENNQPLDQQRPESISDKSWSSLKRAIKSGNWNQTVKLTADDGADGVGFGISLSLLGNRALVSSRQWYDNGSLSGLAYVFEFNGVEWVQTAKLIAADATTNFTFSYSVSLAENRALIGAHYTIDNTGTNYGSAYIFDFNGSSWSQTAKITANDGGAGDRHFGSSVSLSGDRALIGTLFSDAAYIFDFNGVEWVQTARLTPDDNNGHDFGSSVSLSGNRALIGNNADDDNGSLSGSAYVFDFDGVGWNQSAKLLANDGVAYARFGRGVSLFNNKALISAFQDTVNGSRLGSAYVFEFTGSAWSQTAKLNAYDGANIACLGSSVSLSEDRALIGALCGDLGGVTSASAYVFDFNGSQWSQTSKLNTDDVIDDIEDRFGHAVSLSGNRALIGAHLDDDLGTDSGSAYFFNAENRIAVNVSGLAPGNSVIFIYNNLELLTVNADGLVFFNNKVIDGDSYHVAISSQPTTPNQTCTVNNPSGAFSGSNVVLEVVCITMSGALNTPVPTLDHISLFFLTFLILAFTYKRKKKNI